MWRTNPEPDSEVTVKAFLSGEKNSMRPISSACTFPFEINDLISPQDAIVVQGRAALLVMRGKFGKHLAFRDFWPQRLERRASKFGKASPLV
jgi:hypothetical protein